MMPDAEDLLLHRKLLERRSCRAYDPRPVHEQDLAPLRRALASVPTVHGRRSGWAELVTEPARVRSVVRAVVSGLAGKINLWLPRTAQPAALVVCCADPSRSPVRDGRYLYNVDAALAGEAAVAAAACRDLGTVWMAGIGEREVVREMGLAEGQRVVAVIALGHPKSGKDVWDGLTQRYVSGKRRPLGRMAHEERYGAPLAVDPPDPVRRQDMIEHAGGRVQGPLDLEIPAPATRFAGAPDRDQARIVLDAARWAPNAENAQIGRYILVRDPGTQRRALEAAGAGEAADAGDFLLVAMSAAPFVISRRTRQQPFSLIDVPIAALHMILVAHGIGHGYNMLVDVDATALASALGIPPDHSPVGLLMLGRVAGREPAAWSQLGVGRAREE